VLFFLAMQDAKGELELETRWAWFARRAGCLSFWVAFLVALVLRLRDLGIKPLHNDEGVNGWFLLRLIEEGNYAYNPTNYHGPFLYFFGWLPLLTEPLSPAFLRLPMALTGAACLLLLLPLRRRLGWLGVSTAAWLLALGPMQVYFARHAIHETYMVFFTLLAVVAFNRYAERHAEWFGDGGAPRHDAEWGGRTRLLTVGVAALARIYANKETGIITYAAFVCAGLFTWAWLVLTKVRPWEPREPLHLARQELGAQRTWWWKEAGPMFALAATLAGVLAALLVGVSVRVAVYGTTSANAWQVWEQVGPWLSEDPTWKAWTLAGLAAAGGAWLWWGLPGRLVRGWVRAQPVQRRGWIVALGVALFLHVLLFTSLFSSPQGLVDWATSLYHWVKRGVDHEETGHGGKHWAYYLNLMARFELPLLILGGLGWLATLIRRRAFELFVMGWGIAVICAYTIIDYKTPWLVINLTLPLLLSAGVGVTSCADGLRWLDTKRPWTGWAPIGGVVGGLLALALPVLAVLPNPGPRLTPEGEDGGFAVTLEDGTVERIEELDWWRHPRAPWWHLLWDLNWRGHDDNNYEIIYGQTDRDMLDLVDRALPLLEQGERLSCLSPDYWPLPFYLHGQYVGYPEGPDQIPAEDRLILIRPHQEESLKGRYASWNSYTYDVRPWVPVILLVDPELER
jgi:uncharacterized protein (TIGR03663 family)